ncbi:hypothetical protein EUX98_g6333 [Antrodiella citrinella]|uniref:Uncharacterized protein n=1 Tax=Antrodiella citrinella TaxID=2447956 RepID=A0A4S4MP86_9APHY|nr:hypothetical protein EUX98_g6333 [Antrodiella citrinella]
MKTSSVLIFLATCLSSVSATRHAGHRHVAVAPLSPTSPFSGPMYDHATLAHPARSDVYARDTVDYLSARGIMSVIGEAVNGGKKAHGRRSHKAPVKPPPPLTQSQKELPGIAAYDNDITIASAQISPSQQAASAQAASVHNNRVQGKAQRDLSRLVARALLIDDGLFARNVFDRASKIAIMRPPGSPIPTQKPERYLPDQWHPHATFY